MVYPLPRAEYNMFEYFKTFITKKTNELIEKDNFGTLHFILSTIY